MAFNLSFNDVNRRYSSTWVKCNDDSRSGYWRGIFVGKHGGTFTKSGRYWEWTPSPEQMIILEPSIAEPPPAEQQEPSKTWIFKREDGTIVKTKNIHEFCKNNKLTRSSLYEVMSGKRKQHKGFFFVETTIE
jgi:hypothetical protein